MPDAHSHAAAAPHHPGHHHAGHHPKLQHHFDTLEQQKEASTFGMWLFLVTEIMFFGGLFTTYVVYRSAWPREFMAASSTLDWKLGSVRSEGLVAGRSPAAMLLKEKVPLPLAPGVTSTVHAPTRFSTLTCTYCTLPTVTHKTPAVLHATAAPPGGRTTIGEMSPL